MLDGRGVLLARRSDERARTEPRVKGRWMATVRVPVLSAMISTAPTSVRERRERRRECWRAKPLMRDGWRPGPGGRYCSGTVELRVWMMEVQFDVRERREGKATAEMRGAVRGPVWLV